MKKRTRVVLLGCLAALLCIPAGFAIAQATMDEPPEIPFYERHEDPDPSTNAPEEAEAMNQAHEEGNVKAEEEAAEAVRQEILSRDSEADREAAENAPPQAEVPPGTKTYIPQSLPKVAVERCEEKLANGKEVPDPLCELIVLHEEGKVRAGAFSAEQQATALQENK